MKYLLALWLVVFVPLSLMAQEDDRAEGPRAITPWLNIIDPQGQWSFDQITSAGSVIIRSRQVQQERSKKIWVLMNEGSPNHDIALSSLLSLFAQRGLSAVIQVELLDKSTAQDLSYLNTAMEKTRRGRADLIFSFGENLTQDLWKVYRNGITPVVSVAAGDPVRMGLVNNYGSSTGTNFALTSAQVPISAQLDQLQHLVVDLRGMVIITSTKSDDPGSTDHAQATQAMVLAANERSIQTEVLNLDGRTAQSSDELSESLPRAITRLAAFDSTLKHTIIWVDNDLSLKPILPTIVDKAKNVPVLTGQPEWVTSSKKSLLMAIGVSASNNAHVAGIYALAILNDGAQPGDLPVGLVQPPDIAINFATARRIGLKIPYDMVETAGTIYNGEGKLVRSFIQRVVETQ